MTGQFYFYQIVYTLGIICKRWDGSPW